LTERSIPLLKLFGIQVRIDVSWFIIFALITWTLASAYFPRVLRTVDTYVYWIMGASAALMLFASVLLHEMGHSYVAQRLNIPVRGITLFLFGGVSETTEEPKSAKAEFAMTASGWLVSLALGLLFLFGSRLLRGVSDASMAAYIVVRYIGWINIFLFAFNGLPGLPLDGGRLLRAAIWYFSGDARKATYIASSTGSFFGVALIVAGILLVFSGALIGGMWLVLIGFFLRNGAKASYQQLVMRRALEGVRVEEVMSRSIVTMPADISLQHAVNDYFMKYHFHSFPVLSDGQFLGVVSLDNVRNVARDQWEQTLIADITDRDVLDVALNKDNDVMDALSRMSRTGSGRLPVVENSHVVGIISRRDVMQVLSVKTDLGEE